MSSVARAVVVDRDGDAGVGNLVVRHAQPIQCIVFQERRLFRQLHQHLAVRRSGRRHGSLDEQAAHAVFQRLDSLRHRRRRHARDSAARSKLPSRTTAASARKLP
ncbi:hypothetical protein G6F22_021720 [Rhizopus arrhizus]|nr:hypothetical protein G6F22_021720 [Rhizopus arrhizus]